jgi:hypothetical protein
VADARAARRLWRLRKLHHYVDAELIEKGAGRAAVQVFYNGALAYCREWPSRGLALDHAAGKRAELERGGWTFHW